MLVLGSWDGLLGSFYKHFIYGADEQEPRVNVKWKMMQTVF